MGILIFVIGTLRRIEWYIVHLKNRSGNNRKFILKKLKKRHDNGSVFMSNVFHIKSINRQNSKAKYKKNSEHCEAKIAASDDNNYR